MNQENKQAMTRTSGNPLEKVTEFIPFGGQDKIKLSVSIVQNIVAVQTRSGKTCSENDAIKFIMLCSAQRLNPFAGDAYLVGYDGQHGASFSLITAHQAFLKRAESSEHYLGMESGIILLGEDGTITEREGDFHLKEEQVVGGWARVFHAKRPDHPTYRRIRMERFNNGFAQWKQDAAGMICKCAEADALRSTFPTLLGGMYVPGEIIDIKADVEAVRPMFSEQKRVEMVRAREPEGEREEDNSNEEIAPARGARRAASTQPEKTPEPTKQPEGATSPRDFIIGELEAHKITFDDFRDFLHTQGDIRCEREERADFFPNWASIPDKVFETFATTPAKLAKAVKICKPV